MATQECLCAEIDESDRPCMACEVRASKKPEAVNHPAHYGGADDPFEAIKVIEAWGMGLDFCRGNAIKYLARLGKKGDALEDARKAAWYAQRLVEELEAQKKEGK
jgi:hypothetical protein